MKKLLLFTFFVSLYFLSVSAQDISTDPLVVINGKICGVNLKTLDPQSIESMNVLKGESARDAYGVLGEKGVILIYTKNYVKAENSTGKVPEPLVFVNGKLFTASLDSINPNDIESLSVKKNKSATSVYGKAGENGVIMIETKRKISGI